MQIKNLVDYSVSSAQYFNNQTMDWRGRAISFLQANPLAVIVAGLAIIVLSVVVYGYKKLNELKGSLKETQEALAALKAENIKLSEQVEDAQSSYEDDWNGSGSTEELEEISESETKQANESSLLKEEIKKINTDVDDLFNRVQDSEESHEVLVYYTSDEIAKVQQNIEKMNTDTEAFRRQVLKTYERLSEQMANLEGAVKGTLPSDPDQLLQDLIQTNINSTKTFEEIEVSGKELTARTPVKEKRVVHLSTPFKAPNKGSRIQGKKD